MLLSTVSILASSLSLATAAVVSRSAAPVVKTSFGAFQGASNDGVDLFLGVPFAQSPLGALRFARPLPPLPFSGIKNVTTTGNACFQQAFTLPYVKDLNYTALETFVSTANHSEDCLNLNVYRPTGCSSTAKLPVVVYIYGGAFTTGDSSSYNATTLVARSVALGEPVIYVSINYRVNAFGFLAGTEIKDANLANVGLWDQILALEWVQTQISAFGGDPKKVTLWAQSAGGLSITDHMILNAKNPNPPFRAAIFHSSYTSPIDPVDSDLNNYYFNYLVDQTNCTSSAAKIDCLRQVPAATLVDVVNTTPALLSPQGMNFTWSQSIDGVLLNKSVKEYVREGQYMKIPIIAGQNDDEGTLFSIYSANITTDDDFTAYITEEYLAGAPASEISAIVNAYPSDPADGSPYNTGNLSALTPEYKRLAAFHGDWAFQSGRREALSIFKSTLNIWSFLWKRRKDLLYIGSVHGAELPEFYSTIPTDFVATDAVVNFVNYMDPNYPKGSSAKSGLSSITWPKYNDGLEMLLFSDNSTEEHTTTTDTYREVGIQAMIDLSKTLGL